MRLQNTLALAALLSLVSANNPEFWRRQDISIPGSIIADPTPSASEQPTASTPTQETTTEQAPTTTSPGDDDETTTIEETVTPTTTPSATPTTVISPTTSPNNPTTTNQPSPSNNSPTTAPTTSFSFATPTTDDSSTPTDDPDAVTSLVTATGSGGAQTTQVVVIKTLTTSGGSQVAVTSTMATATPSASATNAPGLSGGDNSSSGSSGLSTKSRNTIIGVVVGVGGAILIGALGLVAWRVWGRKRNNAEEEDILMGGGHPGHEKHASIGDANSPFRSTLDQYHNPAGRPNQASNF